MDNVLSQAAVDLLAENAEGDLKKILEEVDIYELNLKTWNDLKDYIAEKSGGEITPAELDRLADAIIPAPEIIAGEEEELLTAEEATTETGERKGKWWILWLLLGAGALFFFIWFLKKRKDDKDESE